jgi:hypothetical protein
MIMYNKNYYNSLLNNYPKNFPSKFEGQIDLDLGRTYPNDPYFKDKENIKKLKNILIAISRRVSTIGYCQGFNFIIGKILKICGNEVIILLIIYL